MLHYPKDIGSSEGQNHSTSANSSAQRQNSYQEETNHNDNLFCIVPQQQLYELLALYRSTNVIKHISMLLKLD